MVLPNSSQTERGKVKKFDKVNVSDEVEGPQPEMRFNALDIRNQEPKVRQAHLADLNRSLANLKPVKTGRGQSKRDALIHKIYILSK